MLVYDRVLKKDVEQVDETDVVLNLKRSSLEFNHFYHEERMNKLGEILWRIDPEIGPVSKMRSITAPDDFGILDTIIYMNDASISIEDLFIVAHEIMHCVLTKEGRSVVIFAKTIGNRNLASCLQTMLEDPVVDSILQNKYKLDALSRYKNDLDLIKNVKCVEEPKDRLVRLNMAFNITNNILKWETISDPGTLNDWRAFLGRYRVCNPNVSKISDDIISIIRETGLGNAEKSRSAFQKIIEKYNLKDILFI